MNVDDIILRKPGYKVGCNQYLCKDIDRPRMLKRIKKAGLTAHPVPGVGYDYSFGGYIYVIGWRA